MMITGRVGMLYTLGRGTWDRDYGVLHRDFSYKIIYYKMMITGRVGMLHTLGRGTYLWGRNTW